MGGACRQIGVVATAVAILASIGATGPAYADDTRGSYHYEPNVDGGVTITKYEGTERAVSVPSAIGGEDVTRIGANAFAGAGLESVKIPSSVRRIGDGAFRDNGLQRVTLGDPRSHRPVDNHGALSVEGRNVVNEDGNTVQLRGISLFHSNWGATLYEPATVDALVDDYQVSLVRAAMNVEKTDGYLQEPGANYARIKAVVDRAIERGIYVIVDWHAHAAQKHTAEAKQFFERFSREYAHVPNVIYEIYNEPGSDVTWSAVKKYARQVVPVIRQHSPTALVIVGTPNYSGHVDVAARKPLRIQNVAYTLHFYADGGGQAQVRRRAADAYESGLPLFVTEWGVGDYSGGGESNFDEAERWMKFLDKRKISAVMWSVSRASTPNTILFPGARDPGIWDESDYSETGAFIRRYLQLSNATTIAPSAFNENAIKRIDVYGRVFGLQQATNYTALDRQVYAQLYTSPRSNPFGYEDLPGAVLVNPARVDIYVRSEGHNELGFVTSTGDGLPSYRRADNPMADFSRYYRVGSTVDVSLGATKTHGDITLPAVRFTDAHISRTAQSSPNPPVSFGRAPRSAVDLYVAAADAVIWREIPMGPIGALATTLLALSFIVRGVVKVRRR